MTTEKKKDVLIATLVVIVVSLFNMLSKSSPFGLMDLLYFILITVCFIHYLYQKIKQDV